jgi:tRNA threonylcarbamoyladenosine biosynthesis protein TsaB
MKILALDTSNNTSSVAISEGANIISYTEDLRPSMQAESIINMIDSVLNASRLSYNEIDYLGVTTGPGSFTGIRIGLATAKGIALGTKINTIPVSNFEISHFRAIEQVRNNHKFFIIINAYRDQLYIQNFSKDSPSGEPTIINSNIFTEILEKEKTGIVCAGSGIEVIYQSIKHLPHLTILPRFPKIRAIDICRYISSKKAVLKPQNLEPLYIRQADAKVPK